jgi:hypothetical protein
MNINIGFISPPLDLGIGLSGSLSGNFGIALSKIDIGLDPIKLNIGLDPIQLAIAPIEIKPIDFSFRLKELPSMRVHLPLNYCVGLALFGFEVLSVRLCGEGQIITEPYVPNPCECGYQKTGLGIPMLVDQVDTPKG